MGRTAGKITYNTTFVEMAKQAIIKYQYDSNGKPNGKLIPPRVVEDLFRVFKTHHPDKVEKFKKTAKYAKFGKESGVIADALSTLKKTLLGKQVGNSAKRSAEAKAQQAATARVERAQLKSDLGPEEYDKQVLAPRREELRQQRKYDQENLTPEEYDNKYNARERERWHAQRKYDQENLSAEEFDKKYNAPERERYKQAKLTAAAAAAAAAPSFRHDKILQSVPQGCEKAQDILDKYPGITLHHDTPEDPLGPGWVRIEEFGGEPALASAARVGKQTVGHEVPSEHVWVNPTSDGATKHSNARGRNLYTKRKTVWRGLITERNPRYNLLHPYYYTWKELPDGTKVGVPGQNAEFYMQTIYPVLPCAWFKGTPIENSSEYSWELVYLAAHLTEQEKKDFRKISFLKRAVGN